MKRLLVFLAALLIGAPAYGQVKQSGNVTPTHATAWTTNGTVQDAGTETNPFITTFGILNGTGTGLCVNSDKSTAAGWQRFCMGTTTAGGAVLSTQNFGSASAQGISFNLNGTPAGLPLVILPTVPGDSACFSNTTGTLVDCGAGAARQIDVFLVIGSSNEVGQGVAPGTSPTPPSTALMYCYNTGVQPLTDPICSAVDNNTFRVSTGSVWPAFAISYGRPVAIVMTAVSGSTQATACDFGVPGQGAWQATTAGSNYALSITAINTALTAFATAGYSPTFRGIIQGDLGTNDAARIDASGCVLSDYTTAFATMAANYRAATIGGATYPHMPIYMALISTNTNPSFPEAPGYISVRNAQQNIVTNDGNTLLPYTNLPSFGTRGLLQSNSVHPVQTGYNEWGYAMGGAILPYVPGTPTIQYISQQTAASPPVPPFNGTSLMIEGADTFFPAIVVDSFGTGVAPVVVLRSAAGTGAAPTATQSGANLGIFAARGYGATGYSTHNNGTLLWAATQNWTDSNQGTSASLFTTPNNSVTPALALFADQDKTVKMPAYGAGVAHFSSAGLISSSAVVSADLNITTTTCTNQFLTAISATGTGTCTTDTLASAQHANQGTTTTVLHGNAAGNPAFAAVVSADLNITTTTCTNQVITAISATATGTCSSVANSFLTNSSVTYGTTTVALGSSSTSIAGLTGLSLTTGSTIDWNTDAYLGRQGAANLRLGQAAAASPVAQTLSVQDVVTGTSNTAGAALTIAGSVSTGTGVGGSISLKTTPAGSTGTSQNALVSAMTILGSGFIGFGTETNPQNAFVFSGNATTGANPVSIVSTFNGPWAIGATSGIYGWNVLTVATLGNNNFIRIDGTVASPSDLGNAETIGVLNFGGRGNGALQAGRARILANTTEAWTTTFGTSLQFDATAAGGSRAQAMLIKGGVIIGSGTTDPGANNLIVGGTATVVGIANVATTSAVCVNPATGLLTYDGTIGTCTVSDERLKNIGPRIDHALAKLMKIDGFNFTFKDQIYGVGPQIGVGAQTVERVFPELVSTDSNGLKSVAYDKLSAPIIEAIRELKADNDNLHVEIDTLKRVAR